MVIDSMIGYPLFFGICFWEFPVMLAYKMVNTLDSMVGYKNERYLSINLFVPLHILMIWRNYIIVYCLLLFGF